MKTIFLKTKPRQNYMNPTYYKVCGTDNNISILSIWKDTTIEIAYYDDELFDNHISYIKDRDLNNPLIEIDRKEFDSEFITISNRLNAITSV